MHCAGFLIPSSRGRSGGSRLLSVDPAPVVRSSCSPRPYRDWRESVSAGWHIGNDPERRLGLLQLMHDTEPFALFRLRAVQRPKHTVRHLDAVNCPYNRLYNAELRRANCGRWSAVRNRDHGTYKNSHFQPMRCASADVRVPQRTLRQFWATRCAKRERVM